MATYIDLATIHSPTPRSKPPSTWGAQIRENFEMLHTNRRFICTSGTRPTGFEGLEIYETDTNRAYIHDGSNWIEWGNLSAWNPYTPTVTQGVAVTKTVTYARSVKEGRKVTVEFDLALTSSGTANTVISVSLPYTAVVTNAVVGRLVWYDASATAFFIADAYLASTTTISGLLNGFGTLLGQTTAGYPNQVVSTDVLRAFAVYEAAA